ncbi:MAG: pentapeptide repeat-containing protein, partial [Aestuariivita sp.]|nr:pentapeptide repeat-containing protein [Aestuariivita sp.]
RSCSPIRSGKSGKALKVCWTLCCLCRNYATLAPLQLFLQAARYIEFNETEFCGNARFEETYFKSGANFNDAKFQDAISFRKAKFGEPPEFFETEIYEDVNFNNADWSAAENSYRWRLINKEDPGSLSKKSEKAIRAWDRLALVMGKQEKWSEQHTFYRLRMRAQRSCEGYKWPSFIANWFFDVFCDYGWGYLDVLLAGGLGILA